MKFVVLTHFRSLWDSDFENCRRFRGFLGQDAKFVVASDYKARSQRWRAQITWNFLHWLDQLLYFYGTDLTQLWMIPSVRNHASNMESMKPRNAKFSGSGILWIHGIWIFHDNGAGLSVRCEIRFDFVTKLTESPRNSKPGVQNTKNLNFWNFKSGSSKLIPIWGHQISLPSLQKADTPSWVVGSQKDYR